MYGHRQAATAAALIMLGAAAGCATPQPPPPTRTAPSRPAPPDRTPVPTSPAPRASGPAERVAAPVARPKPTAITRADLLDNGVDLPAWRVGAPCAADRARLTEEPQAAIGHSG